MRHANPFSSQVAANPGFVCDVPAEKELWLVSQAATVSGSLSSAANLRAGNAFSIDCQIQVSAVGSPCAVVLHDHLLPCLGTDPVSTQLVDEVNVSELSHDPTPRGGLAGVSDRLATQARQTRVVRGAHHEGQVDPI